MIPARENPFRVERTEALAFRPPGLPWEEVFARLEALRYRAAVVGPHGSGKTTFLEELAPRLETRGFGVERVFLNGRTPDLRKSALEDLLNRLGPRDVLIIDGAEFLNRRAWQRIRRGTESAGGLVLATHAPGLLPTLFETRPSVELLRELVVELLGDPKRAAALPLTEVYARHRGNLREALWELYDWVAAGEVDWSPPPEGKVS